MASVSEVATGDDDSRGTAQVDPRAPRFGQSITAAGLLAGIVLTRPILVYAVAAILLLSVLSRWRVDVYAMLWQQVVAHVVDPIPPEPAAPHRFAKLLGATGTTVASALIVGGFPTAGYVLAGAVALAAALAATTGICLGCRMYRSVSFVRRFDIV